MADDELDIEPFSVITKDFPLVVVKENTTLTDEARALLLERFDSLLDAGKPHAIVLDLTNASELPEGQQVFISESLQMRSEEVTSTWISVAIVNAAGNSDLTAFWQKVAPVSSQVFTNTMSAVVWTRQVLEKHARAARQASDPASASLRPSDPSPRRSELGARRSEAKGERTGGKARSPKPPVKGKEASELPRFVRSPITWVGLGGALLLGVLFMLNSPSRIELSSSEQQAFQNQKSKIEVRMFRKVGNKRIPIADGETCSPGSSLRFEVRLPSRAFMFIVGARSAQDRYVAWAEKGNRAAGPLEMGTGLLLANVNLSFDAGREWVHVVACSEQISTDECKSDKDATTLTCPETCTVRTFAIDKASAGT